MEQAIIYISNLLAETITAVLTSLIHNWVPLTLAVLIASAMKVYINTDKLRTSLLRKPKVSILTSVAFGAFTPLCACGTMAVVIGLLTTTLPWGPMMAFLTSSPLMSPDSFVMLTGVIGVKFAVALTVASLIIGLGSGYITHFIEKKTSFLENQTRFSGKSQPQGCGCGDNGTKVAQTCGSTDEQALSENQCGCTGEPASSSNECGCAVEQALPSAPVPVLACECSGTAAIPVQVPACGCSEAISSAGPSCGSSEQDQEAVASKNIASSDCCSTRPRVAVKEGFSGRLRLRELGDALLNVGLKQILLFFSIFVAIGYLINAFVPTSWIMALFRPDSLFSVPLAALIGLPLYVSGDSAIPLIQALMKGGAGQGAMLAFMITGQATSAWVIAGISTFMKRRVIGLYLAFIMIGGIALGYLYDLVLAAGF